MTWLELFRVPQEHWLKRPVGQKEVDNRFPQVAPQHDYAQWLLTDVPRLHGWGACFDSDEQHHTKPKVKKT